MKSMPSWNGVVIKEGEVGRRDEQPWLWLTRTAFWDCLSGSERNNDGGWGRSKQKRRPFGEVAMTSQQESHPV